MTEVAGKPRFSPTQAGGWTMRDAPLRTQDSFTNFLTRTGVHAGNLSSGGHYRQNTITRDRMQLEWIYRGNWVARKIVDAPADDMTRGGIEIQSEDEPSDIETIEKQAQSLQIWNKLATVIKWARLYGGSVGYLMVEGQDPSTELRLETIKKDQFRGILPLDRWRVWPDTTKIITALVPEFGRPEFYKRWPDAWTNESVFQIHYSRLIVLDGCELPYWQRLAENYWGESVLEPIWDRILAFDSTTQGAAQLVYKAHLRTVKVKNLRKLLGENDVAAQALQTFFGAVRAFQSNEGFTLLDSEDEFDLKTYSFTGLPEMLLQFAQQLAGASDIPMVRFFAQSPAGMNATGESDWRNYYDGIHAGQERMLRPGIEKVYALLYRSVLDREPKKAYTLKFKPLWQITDEQSATVTGQIATAVTSLVDRQVFTRSQALKEIRQSADVTGFGTNITDDEIDQAQKDEKEARENPPSPADLGIGTGTSPDDPNSGRRAEPEGGTRAQPRPNGAGNGHL